MIDFFLEYKGDKEELKNKEESNRIHGYKWPVSNPKLVVCFVHGMGEHSGRYNDLATFFNENNISLYAIDLKGHGLSYGKRGDCSPRQSVLDHITMLIELAKAENPSCPICLFGHSLGGNIVLDYRYRGSLNSHISKYVVTAPWIVLQRSFSPTYLKTIRYISKYIPKFLIKTQVGRPDPIDPLLYDKTTLRCAVEGFDIAENIAKNQVTKTGAGVARPLLVMHGTKDRMCKLEGSQAVKDNEGSICTLKVWEDAKHRVYAGSEKNAGEEILAYVVDFLLY